MQGKDDAMGRVPAAVDIVSVNVSSAEDWEVTQNRGKIGSTAFWPFLNQLWFNFTQLKLL